METSVDSTDMVY